MTLYTLVGQTRWALFALTTFVLFDSVSFAQNITLVDSISKDTNAVNFERESAPDIVSTRTLTTVPGQEYRAGSVRRFLFGQGYRDVWTRPVDVPEIDLEKSAGGLTVVQAGGGLQTRSLRLRAANGQEYVLRSVDKDAERSLPDYFQGTLIGDIAQDQIAASHPFAAVVVPPLALAAGIYHVVPSLVVVPDSPQLGEHREEFAGMLAWIEKRPDENQSHDPRLGHSTNVIGFEKLVEEIEDDNDHMVDERAFARARLFDMLIGDWDRHDDQWRWAEFEDGDVHRYVAVPRDRDFAFARFGGALTGLAKLSGDTGPRRLAKFEDDIEDIVGLNFKGAKLDLRFTSSLERSDWLAEAAHLKNALTDQVIDEAVRQLPAPAHQESGAEIASYLKSRRDQLDYAANTYYAMLAQKVDIVGSNKHELFQVERQADGKVQVTLHKTSDEGEIDRQLWKRTFLPNETREIRLYGLGGQDKFVFTGETKTGPRVRAIGGDGSDMFIDDSRVGGPSRKNQFYDTDSGNTWDVGSESRVHRSPDQAINAYELHRYEFNRTAPRLSFAYNNEDGLFIGGGAAIVRTGFRKVPYAARHTLTANYAPYTGEYNLRYGGEFVRLRFGWDAAIDASVEATGDFKYFYGFGNETPGDRDVRNLYRADLQWATVQTSIGRPLLPGLYFYTGPRFQYVSVDYPRNYAPGGRGSGLTPEQYTDKYYAGGVAGLSADTRDSLLYPMRGIRFNTEVSYNAGVRNTSNQFVRVGSDLRLYTGIKPIALALRVGGATNIGDFEFYQANLLGDEDNLRGYRRSRFAGRSSAYASAELRVPLFQLNTYLTRGDFGVLGFVDAGRVWWDHEDSNTIHQGYGGGVWYGLYNNLIVTATAAASNEENLLFNVGLGWQY